MLYYSTYLSSGSVLLNAEESAAGPGLFHLVGREYVVKCYFKLS